MKLRPFELTLVIIFGVMGLLALIIIKTYQPPVDTSEDPLAQIGPVVVWGTLPVEGVNKLLTELADDNESYRNVSYKYYSPEIFVNELTSALADDKGPDLILASQEKLIELRNRIQPLSYDSFPLPDIRARYLDGAQIFAMSDGMYGFPIAVDPLVLYWNRDILTTYGFLESPRTWEMLVNTMLPKLILRDFDRTIRRSVVAMGEYGNVRNAFGIISSLLIQGGSIGVSEIKNNKYAVLINQVAGGSDDPLQAALSFYTRFSNPSNTLYSWNRAFEEDRKQFVSEDLVFYFGYGSEGPQIERINPNLNFDIAEIPQGEGATVRRTYGRFYTLSLAKKPRNQSGAITVMYNLATPAIADKIALYSNMVPAYKSSVALGSKDIYGRVAYRSAAVAYGWLNPNIQATDSIFKTMTSDVNENRRDIKSAADDAVIRLSDEY